MVSQAELILRVITLWFLVLSQFFKDGMGYFKTLDKNNENLLKSFHLPLPHLQREMKAIK